MENEVTLEQRIEEVKSLLDKATGLFAVIENSEGIRVVSYHGALIRFVVAKIGSDYASSVIAGLMGENDDN